MLNIEPLVTKESKAVPGVKYTIEFIGTPKGVDPTGTPLGVASATAQKAKRPALQYPPEVGRVVAFLASEAASYLNGVVLDITGGRLEFFL